MNTATTRTLHKAYFLNKEMDFLIFYHYITSQFIFSVLTALSS